ncbi:helix-turn-helix transcriptional regulator [Mycolicibacter arupensis]|jgi:predicted DNA-binding transcriptional regulator AlpA|uniref:DNA-binding protein n=1 Tax=Mycolicibacter arupensis TaxID=342002 RepID=A0A5C7YER4_9MYCO|nr:helix-turn-helix domain-containing protein [Mycolicibacter arupensis]TXI59963.1 MAG: DNA-binding protein [Mycolicibacter arupensis]
MTQVDRRLTTPEAAEWLGMKRRTLEHWRGKGKGPRYLKVGAKVQYRISDLEMFLREVETSDSRTADR